MLQKSLLREFPQVTPLPGLNVISVCVYPVNPLISECFHIPESQVVSQVFYSNRVLGLIGARGDDVGVYSTELKEKKTELI